MTKSNNNEKKNNVKHKTKQNQYSDKVKRKRNLEKKCHCKMVLIFGVFLLSFFFSFVNKNLRLFSLLLNIHSGKTVFSWTTEIYAPNHSITISLILNYLK